MAEREGSAPVKVPFYDLDHQTEQFEEDVLRTWRTIFRNGEFVGGSRVEAFEAGFAAAHKVQHAIGVSNGTVALELTMRGLGLEPGGKVIVPANSFIATAEAVSNAGGIPVFVDCDEVSGGIDVDHVERTISEGITGIIGVHLYGTPCDMGALNEIAGRYGAWVVEDAAQAVLAAVGDSPVGGLSRAAGFSFYPGKNLGAPGEGGAITTNDSDLADKVRMLRDHGQSKKYQSLLIGTNARMMELVASVLDMKLPYVAQWSEQRRQVADWYRHRLEMSPDIRFLDQPESVTSVFHLFPILIPDRHRVQRALRESGIATGIHYPVPIHLQPAYSFLGYSPGSLPVAELMASRLLSLPMFPGMAESTVDYVVEELNSAVGSAV